MGVNLLKNQQAPLQNHKHYNNPKSTWLFLLVKYHR